MSTGARGKVDNGDLVAKGLVRDKAIEWAWPRKLAVLDCFAGEGHMHDRHWRPVAGKYLGIDQRFHRGAGDPHGECWRGDNATLIARAMARGPWDVVDLDAYANPWPLLRQVLSRAPAAPLVVTATCGIDRAVRVGSSDFGAAVAGAGRLSYLGLMTRWYDDIVRWALDWCANRSVLAPVAAKVIRGEHNAQMRYYALRFEPRPTE